MNHRISAPLLLALLAATGFAQTTRLVPGQYPTIQAAINACINGDDVLVAPGTYPGSISFLGKAITVHSSGGSAVTTISGGPPVPVVSFQTNEGPASILNGFTVTGGAGILIANSSPTIQNCRIVNNVRVGPGAGVYCTSTGTSTAAPSITGSTISNNISLIPSNISAAGLAFEGQSSAMSLPSVTNCTIASNAHAQFGPNNAGGAWVWGSFNVSFTGCTIENHAGASGAVIFGSATFTSCRITGNHSDSGGGIFFAGVSLSVVNTLIAENSASSNGGGIWANAGNPGASVTIKNCTIAGNTSGLWVGGLQVGPSSSGPGPINISNTILQGNSATQLEAAQANVTYSNVGLGLFVHGLGTINTDPLFLDAGGGDFHLASLSPCRNAGAPATTGLPATDFDGSPRVLESIVDIGVDELPTLTYPGTADGLDLYAVVNGAGDPLASTRAAVSGDLLTVTLDSSTGSLVGGLPLFAARLYFTGNSFAVPGGGIWLDSQSVIVYGSLSAPPFGFPGLPPDGLDFSFTVPPGLAGRTVRMQGMITSVNALNGAYATSNATEISF